MTLDDSVAHGTNALDDDVQDVHRDDPDEPITIVAMSQGAVVMNYEKRRLMAEPAADRPTDLTFVTIADPTNADGGLMTKFAPLYIPVLNFTFTGPPVDTPYHTVEYVREYDRNGKFPTTCSMWPPTPTHCWGRRICTPTTAASTRPTRPMSSPLRNPTRRAAPPRTW